MNYKIIDYDIKILNEFFHELDSFKKKYNFLPFRINGNELVFENTSDREILQRTFEIINSSPEILKIDYKSLNIKLDLDPTLTWTFPQARIDCDANKNFASPYHLDKHILNDTSRGIIIWFPISHFGGQITVASSKSIKFIKNEYWGVECVPKHVKEDIIKINFGQALIFDEKLLHKSNPLKEGQITIQLRYFEPSKKNIFKYVNQKSIDLVKDYQNTLFE